jgi:hypothetical protein
MGALTSLNFVSKRPFPPAPWNKTRVDLNTLDPSLKNAAAYSEPGALTNDGRLYLSMSALLPRLGLTGISVGHTIILLASDDHGATWRFVRKLLDDTDASRLGCELFDGTSLAHEDGRFFLLASPGHRGADAVRQCCDGLALARRQSILTTSRVRPLGSECRFRQADPCIRPPRSRQLAGTTGLCGYAAPAGPAGR